MRDWISNDAITNPMYRHGHKFDPDRMMYLESEERKAVLDPSKVLPRFGIEQGWMVVDVGCGPGVFTLPMAGMIGPAGKAYGVDLEPRMLERLKEKVAGSRIGNVEAVLSNEDSVPLPDAMADFILLSTVLHELEGIKTLSEIRRILKESGVLGVIDWKKMAEAIGPPKRHRLSEVEAASILTQAGFEPGPPIDLGPSHYGFKARKA